MLPRKLAPVHSKGKPSSRRLNEELAQSVDEYEREVCDLDDGLDARLCCFKEKLWSHLRFSKLLEKNCQPKVQDSITMQGRSYLYARTHVRP